jgi:hypothetical protein
MSKTIQELQEIALGIHKGLIFTDRHVRIWQELTIVFMPLLFMMEDQTDKLGDVGMVYEYIEKAGSRGINGYPCFMSMRTITQEEAKQVVAYVEKYREAEASVK